MTPGDDPLAQAAVREIRSGTVVGLGTGRAAARAVRALAERRRRENLSLVCVATSRATEELAASEGLLITPFASAPRVDYLFDGADEVDPSLHMLKGGGGAMTRERMVAAAAMHPGAVRVNLIDSSKLVPRLGTRMPLPIELSPFARASVIDRLGALGLEGHVRQRRDGGGDLVTDNGNLILDAALPEPLATAAAIRELAARLDATPGVIDHGLFLDEAQALLVEYPDGRVERVARV